jgi:hypothetical protein
VNRKMRCSAGQPHTPLIPRSPAGRKYEILLAMSLIWDILAPGTRHVPKWWIGHVL